MHCEMRKVVKLNLRASGIWVSASSLSPISDLDRFWIFSFRFVSVLLSILLSTPCPISSSASLCKPATICQGWRSLFDRMRRTGRRMRSYEVQASSSGRRGGDLPKKSFSWKDIRSSLLISNKTEILYKHGKRCNSVTAWLV